MKTEAQTFVQEKMQAALMADPTMDAAEQKQKSVNSLQNFKRSNSKTDSRSKRIKIPLLQESESLPKVSFYG